MKGRWCGSIFGRCGGPGALRITLALPAVLMTIELCPLVQPARAAQPWTIPALREWTDAAGSYTFGAGTRIVVDPASANDLSTTASTFGGELAVLTGMTVPVVIGASPQPGDISLALGATDSTIGEEGYLLTVADRIAISAQTDAGVFYGTRSVLQMLKQGLTIQAGTVRDWPDFSERGLMLNMEAYYSLPFLERHIKDLAYLKLNYLHLHLSDNQEFMLESSSHPEIVAWQHYSKAEMTDLIELAREYHVTIVPEIDVPAHAQAILTPHPDLALPGSPDKVDLGNPASYALIEDLLNEYLPLFPAPFWHTGTDEYLAFGDYSKYPQLLTYARQLYGPNAVYQDIYIGFANWVDGIVKAHGKQLRAWNDLVGVVGNVETPNPDIVLEMWWPNVLPQDLLAEGHTIINCEAATTYFPVDPNNLYENWAPNQQWVTSYNFYGTPIFEDLPASTPGIRGGKLHVWTNASGAAVEQYVQDGLAPELRGLAQNSWGSPKLTPTSAAFASIMNAIGDTPDWASSLMPAISPGGIVNAASYAAGAAVSPGSIVSVFGSFPLYAPAQAPSLPLPSSLVGVSVNAGGFSAPLFFAAGPQVNIQIPWELAGQSQATLIPMAWGETGAVQTVSLGPFSPGIFTMNAQGFGQGAIQDTSYRLVDSSNPAAAGSLVSIYCTGLGAVTDQPPTGAPAPVTPLAETTTKPTVVIGGAPASVQFSGLAPGLVGAYQVNAVVPSSSATGDAVPVTISIGGITSNTVTIAVGSTP
ncbi:MAG: family 20 glycosylhydrolase [Bryobacteraceae bacterium]|jgi:hexosaminidase